jgi:small subunit ribosomal protein S7
MRGKPVAKRSIAPDPKFGSTKIAKFINYIMKNGKKTVAQKIVYQSFSFISDKTKRDPIEIFEEALKNVAPVLVVKSRRVGGANYQIPIAVSAEEKIKYAFHWLIDAARAKKGKPMAEKLASEFMLAAKNEGDAIKKKEETHRMAEANKAFAHFA